jgi:predicted PurR-regulated permease PerM
MAGQEQPAEGVIPRLTSTERQRLLLFAVVAGVVLYYLWQARAALTPFAVGLVLAYLLLPLVTRVQARLPESMHRRGHARMFAVVIVYLAAFVFVAAALTALIPPIVEQAVELLASAPDVLVQAEHVVIESIQSYEVTLERLIGAARLRALTDILAGLAGGEFMGKIAAAGVDAAQATVGTFVRAITGTVSWILGFIVIPFWMVYVMTDAERLQTGTKGLVPANLRGDAHALVTIVDRVLSAYIRGQLIIAIALGTLSAIALALLGVPYALLLGVATGILGMIPFLGAIIAAVLAFVVALTDSPSTAVKALVAYLAVQQVDNFFITPRTQSGAVALHPAVIMLVLVVAQALIGPIGLLIAVPLTAILRDTVHYTYLRLGSDGMPAYEALTTVGYALPPELAALAPPESSAATAQA